MNVIVPVVNVGQFVAVFNVLNVGLVELIGTVAGGFLGAAKTNHAQGIVGLRDAAVLVQGDRVEPDGRRQFEDHEIVQIAVNGIVLGMDGVPDRGHDKDGVLVAVGLGCRSKGKRRGGKQVGGQFAVGRRQDHVGGNQRSPATAEPIGHEGIVKARTDRGTAHDATGGLRVVDIISSRCERTSFCCFLLMLLDLFFWLLYLFLLLLWLGRPQSPFRMTSGRNGRGRQNSQQQQCS